jgi:hypothetical protein
MITRLTGTETVKFLIFEGFPKRWEPLKALTRNCVVRRFLVASTTTDSSGGGKHWSRRHPVLIYEVGWKRINIGAHTTD